ncbi:DHHW family protein [Terrisporobacter mayombei]|uniref:AlgX/AlgJ SGNH hydrolase-like domain-containing protein n=1 Tax=Terrisporobacter mayombei TaxID=1541 RepID=A0ABY9Q5T0_9FIRM|nr:DHHW family protein [Terrisporobacter mayombei]MCC3869713.1 hypothetical protein [Terrisporobacter mayombei]WMT83347.1 hypothetical protein TEMA_38580 [Terrisporobacter mayombei]
MNNKKAKYIAIPFLISIIAILFIHTISKDKEISASENRALAQIPTVEDVKKEDFTTKFENYFSDQFPFREELSQLYNKVELMLGKNKIKNYYVLENNWVMPTPIDVFSEEDLKDSAEKINELSQAALKSNKKVYYASTPHKESMLTHLYPKFTKGLNNATENKNKFKSYLDKDKIDFIDIDEDFLSKFNEKEREKLYFKTDHHWNGIGAYEGFKTIMEEMKKTESIKNINWDNYIKTDLKKGYFLGSYNLNLNNLVKEDEDIPYVHSKNKHKYEYFKYDGKKETKGKEEDFVATRIHEDEILYGGAYMFGNACNILKIKNKDALNDKKILIIRDSYQAPTSWLFADMFSEVQLVDPRYTEKLDLSIKEIIEDSDADIVMFMYNSTDFKSMIDEIK